MAARLRMYGRTYCHLCTDMERRLRELQGALGFDLEVHDVDADPALEERFGAWVPVLMAGDTEICHYFLDEDALRRYLGGA